MGSKAADGELQRKINEYKARERIYFAGLLGQAAETGQLRQMAADVLSAYGDVSKAGIRGALAYPTANMEVLLLRQKLRKKDQQITQLKEELEANRFDQRLPDGQALMKKCKALLTENRELGEEIREERIAELRVALRAERGQNAQLYQKVQEASEFCKELSEENEKLQGTIARVAGRLRESRTELEVLVKERAEAKKKRKLERDARAAKAAAVCTSPIVVSPVIPIGSHVPVEHKVPPTVPAPVASPVVAPVPAPTPAPAPLPAPLPAPVQHQVFAPPPVVAEDGAQAVKEKKKEKKEKSKKRKHKDVAADNAEGEA